VGILRQPAAWGYERDPSLAPGSQRRLNMRTPLPDPDARVAAVRDHLSSALLILQTMVAGDPYQARTLRQALALLLSVVEELEELELDATVSEWSPG
jgi:hypothetical protein